jgi:hypothetical protein
MSEWPKVPDSKGEPAPHSPAENGSVAKKPPARDDDDRADTRGPSHSGQSRGNADPVETALADALTKASAAGEWTTVAALARELEARRKGRQAPEVIILDAERRRRER